MAKSVTLKDIAAEADVGVITVSRALRGIGRVSDETRARIIETATRMGYTRSQGVFKGAPARPGSNEHKLNLVLPAFMGDMKRISGPFGEEITQGLQERLEATGGELHIISVSKPEDIIERWPRKKVHGVILRHSLPAAWVNILKNYAPVVYPVAQNAHLGVDSVNYDEEKSTTMMLNHLLDAGHTNILCLGYIYHRADTHLPSNLFDANDPRDRQAHLFFARRLGAWHAAKESMCGLADIKIKLFRSSAENVDFDQLRNKALDYYEKQENKPTALVLLTNLASGLLTKASQRGLHVPRDFSVLTYQPEKGDSWNGLNVSGIRLPTTEVGKAIPEIIERRMAFPDARAISLDFECNWHQGETLTKREV
jgi:DNA-binding LacI/PurR family transcriptional regulator